MTCTKLQLKTMPWHTPTVVSSRIGAGVIHDDPLTLCPAPFKLQIVLHTLFRTRKDHIVLSDVAGCIICSNTSNSPALTQTSACSTETARITHATCDSHGDMLNTLTLSVTQGSGLGNRRPLFSPPGARRVVVQACK